VQLVSVVGVSQNCVMCCVSGALPGTEDGRNTQPKHVGENV